MLATGSWAKKRLGAPAPHVGPTVTGLGPVTGTKIVFSLPHWFWHGFGLYVWVHAGRFGSQPECNAATKLIVFGRELSATGSGRVVSLGE